MPRNLHTSHPQKMGEEGPAARAFPTAVLPVFCRKSERLPAAQGADCHRKPPVVLQWQQGAALEPSPGEHQPPHLIPGKAGTSRAGNSGGRLGMLGFHLGFDSSLLSLSTMGLRNA